VKARVEVLKKSRESPQGWRSLIHGGDIHDAMSQHEIWCTQERAEFLSLALQLALENMGRLVDRWTWTDCCTEAVKQLNRLGHTLTTHEKTLRRWHTVFQKKNCFPDPHPNAVAGRAALPAIFEAFPQGLKAFCKYADENLDGLTSYKMSEYCMETLFPELHKIHNAQQNEEDKVGFKEFLQDYGLKKLAPNTVTKWMNHLGYKYSMRKKHYYNDKHESPENKAYRDEFIRRYKTTKSVASAGSK
jgi:hypothetical protein